MMRKLGLLAGMVGAAFATPAVATQWLSDNASAAVAVSACNNTTTPAVMPGTCQMTMAATSGTGTGTVKVRAYSTRTSDHSQNGIWQSADIHMYQGGFGVTNLVAGDTGEGITPEHAVDNNQVYDVLVFELPSTGMDIDSFRLGWAQESGNNWADVQTWFGGNNLASNFDFSTVCFTSTCSGGTQLANLGGGFTDITSTMKINGTSIFNGGDNNVPVGQQVDFSGTQSGQYLVVAGRLGDSFDNFKVDMLKASGGGPGGQTPVPGTLALLGLGLAGLVSIKKRRPASA